VAGSEEAAFTGGFFFCDGDLRISGAKVAVSRCLHRLVVAATNRRDDAQIFNEWLLFCGGDVAS
jgi:hypothetical protein